MRVIPCLCALYLLLRFASVCAGLGVQLEGITAKAFANSDVVMEWGYGKLLHTTCGSTNQLTQDGADYVWQKCWMRRDAVRRMLYDLCDR